jgi:hypothetical protein
MVAAADWRACGPGGAEQARGRDSVLARWLTRDDVFATPLAETLEGVAACLLDRTDDVRRARIERRAASGTWRQHTAGEVAGYMRAAAGMRESAAGMVRLDTSGLDPEVGLTSLWSG